MLRTIRTHLNTSYQFSSLYGRLLEIPKLFEIDKLQRQTPLHKYIEIYRDHGHHYSQINPLNPSIEPKEVINPLDLKINYNDPLNQSLFADESFLICENQIKSVKELESSLKKVYCGTVGVEFSHIRDQKERDWLYYNYERIYSQEFTKTQKLNIISSLIQTEAIDHFLQKKFNTFKRYGGEGVESQIPALKEIFALSGLNDIKEIVLGISHRGKINVLCSLLDYPLNHLFNKIRGQSLLPAEVLNLNDDVVSHIAVTRQKRFFTASGKQAEVKVSMLHNPSHLEAVNPVSQGKTKAKIDQNYNSDFKKVLNVQVHGDSAFSAQGIIYESLLLGKVPRFETGGTIHLITNNQIGFTTNPQDGRTCKNPTEICKTFQIPIIHVNADDPESVVKVAQLAVEYRQKFFRDIMIDLVGYRRYGHNEIDEPDFTQPHTYEKVKAQKTCPLLYSESLVKKGIIREDFYEQTRQKVFALLQKEFEIPGPIKYFSHDEERNPRGQSSFNNKWNKMDWSIRGKEPERTGFNKNQLKTLAIASVNVPPSINFSVHDRIQKYFIQERIKNVEKNSLDWATAEILAFSSLLEEGFSVRLSGEDVERGTFSQRHTVFTDLKTEQTYNCVKENSESMGKGKYYVVNSPLSEQGVLSYEYGYNLESPYTLNLWEAQFGDFVNCAQVTLDNFIIGSEEKWGRQTGIVILLPHGFDGAGPEHSSAKIERFLSLVRTNGVNPEWKFLDNLEKNYDLTSNTFTTSHQNINFQVINPTTPANYFHALRRQMLRNYRKPLVVIGPKILLRHPQAKSTFEELDFNTAFIPVYQKIPITEKTRKVILTTGKFSYDIQALITNTEHVACLSLEELAPFPEQTLENLLAKCHKNIKLYWVQDESLNFGAFSYVLPHLQRIFHNLAFEYPQLKYIGLKASPICATGKSHQHSSDVKQLKVLIQQLN